MSVNWSNVTTWVGFLQVANTNTGSWFWTALLYGIWFVCLLLFSAWGFEVTLLASSFIALILGLFLVYGSLMSWEWLLTFIGIILITFLYIAWTGKKT